MDHYQPQRKPITTAFLSRSVYHFECNAVIAALERSLKTTGLNPTGLMIVGDSGLGKSTALRLFEQRFSRPATETNSYKTVANVVTPVDASVKSLCSALLKVLGCPTPDRGTANSMFTRITTLIHELDTKIIIFYEIQHLTERNAQKKTRPVINLVKNLMTETNCPVVLVGMPDATELLSMDPQLARRFSKSVTLKPFSMTDELITEEYTAYDLYVSFLHSIASFMPIKTINLIDPNVARRLLAASRGKISIIIKILEFVIENSLDGKKATLLDFSTAFRDIADHDISHCPFLITSNQLEKWYFS
ncbi:TniB family NTP-binding protein [Shewanella sp. M-Br]|uniref:TniB family NTP-binding protein n=1 Tax=Shewanella sp. M-Br TaxID=2495595 RepID=UPI00294A2685|nr:transposase [Shewanella sp. M-Br]